MPRPATVLWILLSVAAALALLAGIYARFDGLAAASMVADEYYIARSVQNILRVGIPEYVCGGLYPRAIAFQYVVAGFASGGLGIENVGRWVAAISGVIALPAVWLLARRAGGRGVALAALTIIGISVWEVEVSRFGRMYAPFQAVFVWYAWFYLRYVLDGQARALWALLALAVMGTATWEGGIFLLVANGIAPFIGNARGRLRPREWIFIGANVVLFLGLYRLLTANLRVSMDQPAFPEGFDPEAGHEETSESVGKSAALAWSVSDHPGWLIGGAIVLLPLLALALRLPWRMRERWPGAAALCLVLVFALLQQFALVASVLVLVLLMGLIGFRDLWGSRDAYWYWGAVAVCAAFWTAFGLLTVDWAGKGHVDLLRDHAALRFAYEFIRVPDLFSLVLVPWVRSVPHLTAVLAVLVGLALLQSLARTGTPRAAQDVVMLLLVAMLVGVGLSEPPRLETRYIFFLYPLLIVMALCAVTRLIERPAERQPALVPLAMLIALGVFALTEDFQPRHLAQIDSQRALLRLDVSPKLATHIVPRTDVRGAAAWLAAHAVGTPAVLINAFPGADYYFPKFHFTYINEDAPRFRAYACRRGTYDRWGNLPLIYSLPQLEAQIEARGGNAVVLANHSGADELMTQLARWHPRVAWTAPGGDIRILVLGTQAARS